MISSLNTEDDYFKTFCRRVYRQIDGDSFLYYWDWGPNSGIQSFSFVLCDVTTKLAGTNWMVSNEWWKGET